MPILKVDDFKAKLKGGGARSNLFDVILSYPSFVGEGDTEASSFLCRSTSLPGSTMEEVIVPFRGRQVKLAGDRTFENWAITVYNDTDMIIRRAMERWMNGINAHSENSGLTSPLEYQADMTVRQLDKDSSILKTYNIIGAFPTVVSPIELSFDPSAEIEQFEVTFAYQYWTSDTTS